MATEPAQQVESLLAALFAAGWLEAWRALECESGVLEQRHEGLGPAARLLRDQVLDGLWEEATPSILALLESCTEAVSLGALSCLWRQRLFELVYRKPTLQPPEARDLVACLEQLRACEDDTGYHELVQRVTDITRQPPAGWSPLRGRLDFLEAELLPKLREATGQQMLPEEAILQRQLPSLPPAVPSASLSVASGDGECGFAPLDAEASTMLQKRILEENRLEPAQDESVEVVNALHTPSRSPQTLRGSPPSERPVLRASLGYEHLLPELLRPVAEHREPQAIRCAAFGPSGYAVALGTNTRALVICEVPDESELDKHGGESACSSSHAAWPDPALKLKHLGRREKVHGGSIYCVSWDAPRGAAATGSNDQSVRLLQLPPGGPGPAAWSDDSESSATEGRLLLRAGAVRGVAFLRGGGGAGQPLLAAISDGQAEVRLWDAETQVELTALGGLAEPASALAAPQNAEGEPLGPLCAAGGSNCLVWDLRVKKDTPAAKLSARGGCRLASVAVAAGAGAAAPLVAAGGQGGQVLLWDLRRGGAPCARWAPHSEAVRSVALDPSKRYLAAASMDGTISICDLWLSSDPPQVLRGHTSHAVCVLWHPTRPLLLSTSADGVALLWGAVGPAEDL
ncbi:unnamed protein product, partial [Polarella glacialis]